MTTNMALLITLAMGREVMRLRRIRTQIRFHLRHGGGRIHLNNNAIRVGAAFHLP